MTTKPKQGAIKKGISAIKNRKSQIEAAEKEALRTTKKASKPKKKKPDKYQSEMDRLRGIKKKK